MKSGERFQNERQSSTSFFHYDSKGNVILLTDVMGGCVIDMVAVTGIAMAQGAQLVDTHQTCVDPWNEFPF